MNVQKTSRRLGHFEVIYGYVVVLFIEPETSDVIELHDQNIHENTFIINDWAIRPEISHPFAVDPKILVWIEYRDTLKLLLFQNFVCHYYNIFSTCTIIFLLVFIP